MQRLSVCLTVLFPFVLWASTPAEIRQWLDAWNVAAAVPAGRALVAATAGPPSIEQADALGLLGESLSLAGDPSALRILDEALRLRTSLVPAGDASLADLRRRRAAELSHRQNHAEAASEYRSALALAGDGGQARAAILLGLGGAYSALGQFVEARTTLGEALVAATSQFGENSRQARDVLRALSTLSYLQTDLPAAEKFLVRAAPPAGADATENAQFRLLSAGLAMERGRYGEAEEGLRQALAFYESRLGERNRSLVAVLRNVARCYRFQAQFEPAALASERALAISVEAFGEESPATSQLLGILAAIKAESGQLPEARQLYDRALGIQVRALGPKHPVVGAELFSLANLEQVMGDFESSLRHAAESLAIREAIDGKQSARTVTIYSLLGRVHALNGNRALGRELTELAVAIGRRTVGDHHPRTVFAVSDLGEVRYLSKDYAAAHRHFTESLAGQMKLFGADTIRTAQGEYNLGLAERALQHHAEALERFRRAGRIWREAFGPDYLFLAETNAGEAASLAALQRPAEALAPALEAARVRRVSNEAVSMTAAEREALLFARVDRDGLLTAIDLAASGGWDAKAVASIWDAVIRDRAAVYDAMARRRLSSVAGGARIAQWKKELSQAALVGDPKIYASRVTGLRQSIDDAERRLGSENGLFARQMEGSRAGLREVIAAIPARTALVAYARGASQYVAFVCQPSGAVRAVSLGTVTRIDALAEAWQRELERERTSAGRNARRNEAAYRQAGVALRRAIWDPLSPLLTGSRAVYAALDGALRLVNLDTLPVGAAQYLAEVAPVLAMLSAERDLVSAAPPIGSAKAATLLAFGNPGPASLSSAASRDGCADLHPSRFPRAAGFGRGGSRRGSALDRSRGAGAGFDRRGGQRVGAEVILGRQARSPSRRARLLSPGLLPKEREALLMANPLLRSGLVLAAGGVGQEDGLLTAEEVSGLPLRSTELVVLSGCDTARGTAQAGEGLLGLRRAFHAAGARHVVSSLWPIEDAATRQWMIRFYRSLLQSASGVAASVRAASIAALRERRASALSTHPFYWGGFVSSGF